MIVSKAYVEESTFDSLIQQLSCINPAHQEMGWINGKEPVKIDLREVQFIDPYGMLGLLELGRYLKKKYTSPLLILPHSEEVLKYLERMDFWKYALELFELESQDPWPKEPFFRSQHSDVLLELTRIEETDDIHNLVEKVRERAGSILVANLNYSSGDIDAFVVALSEVCQNIPEHSQDIGYVAIQKYFYEKKLGKNVAKIAVMDLGIGIKASLSSKYAALRKDWSDSIAIKMAVFEGASRYDDPGRGQGLVGVRKLVEKWNGKFVIRSGSAKVGLIPSWDNSPKYLPRLPYLPGTQISITLPELSNLN